jgi:FkbM family methyltransferase
MKLRTQSPLWRRIIRLLGRQLFRLAENNDDPRFSHNGEGWLLRRLLAAHARTGAGRAFVVFDAGANAGEYTREALAAAQRAGCGVAVHAFEPSPHCLETLRRNFTAEPAVRIIGAALADRNGEASLHDGRAGSSQASLVPRDVLSGAAAATITVPLLRLCDYLEAQAVTQVDLLKLDVEGSELAALRGLGERLRPDVIDVIQFEYGGAAIDAGTTLRDLYRLLTARGYVLAKLFPDALEVRGYRPWMEHYAYANYVALSPRWLAAQRPAP